MKMVAAAKMLRRAQDRMKRRGPTPSAWSGCWSRRHVACPGRETAALMRGTGKDDVHLIVVVTADRGLCGGFNSNIVRSATRACASWKAEGKTVKMLAVGKKGRDYFKREFDID